MVDPLCFPTGITKAVVCVILSVGWYIIIIIIIIIIIMCACVCVCFVFLLILLCVLVFLDHIMNGISKVLSNTFTDLDTIHLS